MPGVPWERLALAVLLAVGEAAPTRQVHKHQHLDYLVEKLEQIRSNVSVASQVETPKLPAPQLVPASLNSERSFSKLKENWEQYQLQCYKYFHETPPLLTEGKFCNRTFDDYICWPDGLPGTYVNMSCPWYLPSVTTGDIKGKWVSQGQNCGIVLNVEDGPYIADAWFRRQVYRFCTLEGTWLLEENSTKAWRNTSECEDAGKDAPKERLLFLSVVYTTGYALSFSALVIATGILLGFRHLHCTRNYIHLNLFGSFILRAVSVFIKDSVLTWMYSTATHEYQWEKIVSYQESLSCRLVFVMMHYCVTANYYWLLVEGMYLYTLLVVSVFSEQRIFRLYLCIGWGYPGCVTVVLVFSFLTFRQQLWQASSEE